MCACPAPVPCAARCRPKKGDTLLFWDMHPDGKNVDRHALHASCPTYKGEKWTATKWYVHTLHGRTSMTSIHGEMHVHVHVVATEGCRVVLCWDGLAAKRLTPGIMICMVPDPRLHLGWAADHIAHDGVPAAAAEGTAGGATLVQQARCPYLPVHMQIVVPTQFLTHMLCPPINQTIILTASWQCQHAG